MIIEVRKGALPGDEFGELRITDAEIEALIASDSGASVGPLVEDRSAENGCFTLTLRIRINGENGG